MGGGSWTRNDFAVHTVKAGLVFDEVNNVTSAASTQDVFKRNSIAEELNPYNAMRECKDTEEHPNTIPVILALDVTGSMGRAATEIAKSLNKIMENVLSGETDVEFCVMGIGDLAYDHCPIQISQFESDIRIAEHMDKVYFEFGGGGNSYESYTVAWYMGARHTLLDCWKRDKKGIIITIGDETLNPYLPQKKLEQLTGDILQEDIDTKDLYKEASEVFDIYHIFVDHGRYMDQFGSCARKTFGALLPEGHLMFKKINEIPEAIISIINGDAAENENATSVDGISW